MHSLRAFPRRRLLSILAAALVLFAIFELCGASSAMAVRGKGGAPAKAVKLGEGGPVTQGSDDESSGSEEGSDGDADDEQPVPAAPGESVPDEVEPSSDQPPNDKEDAGDKDQAQLPKDTEEAEPVRGKQPPPKEKEEAGAPERQPSAAPTAAATRSASSPHEAASDEPRTSLRVGVFPGANKRNLKSVSGMALSLDPLSGKAREFIVCDEGHAKIFSLDGLGGCRTLAGSGANSRGWSESRWLKRLPLMNPKTVALQIPGAVIATDSGEIVTSSGYGNIVLCLSTDRTRLHPVARAGQVISVVGHDGRIRRVKLSYLTGIAPCPNGFLVSASCSSAEGGDEGGLVDSESDSSVEHSDDPPVEDGRSIEEEDFHEINLFPGASEAEVRSVPVSERDFVLIPLSRLMPVPPKPSLVTRALERVKRVFGRGTQVAAAVPVPPSAPVELTDEPEDSIDDEQLMPLNIFPAGGAAAAPAHQQDDDREFNRFLVFRFTSNGLGFNEPTLFAGGGRLAPSSRPVSAKRIKFDEFLRLGTSYGSSIVLFDDHRIYFVDQQGKLTEFLDCRKSKFCDQGSLRSAALLKDGNVVIDYGRAWVVDPEGHVVRGPISLSGNQWSRNMLVAPDGSIFSADSDRIVVTGTPLQAVPSLKVLAAAGVRERQRMLGLPADVLPPRSSTPVVVPLSDAGLKLAGGPTLSGVDPRVIWGELLQQHPHLRDADTTLWLSNLKERTLTENATPPDALELLEKCRMEKRTLRANRHGQALTVWRAADRGLHVQLRSEGGDWARADEIAEVGGERFRFTDGALNDDGSAWVAWENEDPFHHLFVSHMDTGGRWSDPVQVTTDQTAPADSTTIRVTANKCGELAACWVSHHLGRGFSLNVRFRSDAGTWTPIRSFFASTHGVNYKSYFTDSSEAMVLWLDGVEQGERFFDGPKREVLRCCTLPLLGDPGQVHLLSGEREHVTTFELRPLNSGRAIAGWQETVGLRRFRPARDPFERRGPDVEDRERFQRWIVDAMNLRANNKPAQVVRAHLLDSHLMRAGVGPDVQSETQNISEEGAITGEAFTALSFDVHEASGRAIAAWSPPRRYVATPESEIAKGNFTRQVNQELLATVRVAGRWGEPVSIFSGLIRPEQFNGTHQLIGDSGNGVVLCVLSSRLISCHSNPEGEWGPVRWIEEEPTLGQVSLIRSLSGEPLLLMEVRTDSARKLITRELLSDGTWGARRTVTAAQYLALVAFNGGHISSAADVFDDWDSSDD